MPRSMYARAGGDPSFDRERTTPVNGQAARIAADPRRTASRNAESPKPTPLSAHAGFRAVREAWTRRREAARSHRRRPRSITSRRVESRAFCEPDRCAGVFLKFEDCDTGLVTSSPNGQVLHGADSLDLDPTKSPSTRGRLQPVPSQRYHRLELMTV